MRQLGLQLRLTSSLTDLIKKAIHFKLSLFQCFFVQEGTGRFIKLQESDVRTFLKLRRAHFNHLYVHASYWINLASLYHVRHYILEREIRLAKRLEFTHIIVHPGVAKGAVHKDEGVDAIARVLNRLLKREHEIQIVLENTAHGNFSVGSDLYDFEKLLGKLDHPEKLSFCIDTAHAYSYGYDITSDGGQTSFIALLEKTVGLDRIVLIHLNDTCEEFGSKIDRHYIVGKGNIGKHALQKLILHPDLVDIPLLMELPVLSDQEEKALVEEVRNWL